jgi:histidyl-tRNA synthetase
MDRKEGLSKLFYIGPMFRGERPQKGRLRQFHQIGVEAMGPQTASPYLDAEVIRLAAAMLERFGLKDFTLKLNTLGTAEDKERFAVLLREKIAGHFDRFCPDCQSRYERNVFRVLDCKNLGCREALKRLELRQDHLCETSRVYFEAVKTALNSLAVRYEEDPFLVRGLDYYTHTVFEFSCSGLGSQDAVGAGGRYDNLVAQLGGPDVDAVGFALGMERILLAAGREPSSGDASLDVFVIALGNGTLSRAFGLLQKLRDNGVSAEMRFSGGSLKSQMRQAGRLQSRYVLMLGEDELSKGIMILKNMADGEQEELSIDNIERIITIVKDNKEEG